MDLLRRFSLRTSLGLFVVLPVLVALAIAAFLALQVFERQAEDRMEEDVELVARAIRSPLSRALGEGQRERTEELLQSAFSIERVYGAHLYDRSGATVASVGRFAGLRDARIQRAIEEGDPHGVYRRVGNEEVFSFFVPLLSSEGRVIGLLEVSRLARDIHAYVNTLRWEAVLFIVIAALVMGGVVIWGHQQAIGRPLGALHRSMKEVEEGDRSHRAEITGPWEIAELAEALNQMLESIEEAEREIEQRRDAQITLERQLKQAEKLAAIGQISSGIAHEIGSPLSVIEGKAQRALRGEDLSEAHAQTLESIRAEVRRVEHVIHQLLEFGRHHDLDPRVVRLDRLVGRSVNALREKIDQQEITIEVSGPEPAPTIDADPSLVERALTNLLRNAVEASRNGTVRVEWFSTESEAGFRVEDDGPGIDESEIDRLFEPFFTTKKIGEGAGLGLAVSKAIVEEHEGRIEVTTSELGGAAFVAYFDSHSGTAPVDS